MSILLHAFLAGLLLGAAAWASNIWPGVLSWRRAALSRFLWWGAPFGAIALLCDVSPAHAAWLGGAAWIGAWVPHTAMPDIGSHLAEMLTDLVVVVIRVALLLAAPSAVFWLCGAFWFAMVLAVAGALLCILIGNTACRDLGVPGLRTPRQVAGALFGFSTGVWVAVAILVPDPLPDLLV